MSRNLNFINIRSSRFYYFTFLVALFMFFSGSEAQTFHSIKSPLGLVDILSIGPGGTIYAGSDSKGNITSTDGGVNWVGLGGETYAAGETDAHCFSAAGQIMTGTQQWGIKSWNGSSWSSMNTGLPTYGSLYP